MLAGATGIDLVLLVIAADEGMMPQTREHLDILRFLPVHAGIVVLNKIDLVEDPSWLSLVKDDVKSLVAGTFLQGAPVVALSAKTGQGIPELVKLMDQMLDQIPARQADAPVRLPIDRVFTMAGFGTIVTGTLWSGQIAVGDTLEVLPQGAQVRVRGVQTHGQTVAAGIAGSRVATNLAGVEKKAIERGNVLCAPGAFKPTDLMDIRIRLLADAPALSHLARVRLYLGSDEAIGRLSLLMGVSDWSSAGGCFIATRPEQSPTRSCAKSKPITRASRGGSACRRRTSKQRRSVRATTVCMLT